MCIKTKANTRRLSGYIQRALAIRETALGPSHPEVATSLNNLGLASQAQGKYAEATGFLQRALAISEKTLGPSHPDVATSLDKDTEALSTKPNASMWKLRGLYRRALAIREKALGPIHPDVATSLRVKPSRLSSMRTVSTASVEGAAWTSVSV